MADPTEKILKLFADKSAWDLTETVPIFVPHEVTHKDGSKVTVDEDRLEKICENINTRFKERRVPVVFTEGHRVPTFPYPEKDQPDILAYGKDAFIDDFEGSPAIWIHQYVLKDCLPKVKKYPFRSSEFRSEENEITGVALLKRDPKLDMGLVLYQQSNPNIYSFQAEDGVTCLYMENTMPDLMNDDTGLETTPPAPPGGGFLDEFKKAYPKFDEMYAKMCGPDMADPGAPPAGGMGDDPTMNYQRDNVPPALAKRIATLEENLAAEKKEKREIKARQLISSLVNDYKLYMDNPRQEVEDLLELPDKNWDSHITRIKKNYQRDPTAGDIVPVGENTRDQNGDPEPASAAEAQNVVLYAERNSIDISTPNGWSKAKVEYSKSKRQKIS